MCKAKAEGGKRCASHIKKALTRAQAAYEAKPTVDNYMAVMAAQQDYAENPTGWYKVWQSISADLPADESKVRKSLLTRGMELRDIARMAEQSQRPEEPYLHEDEWVESKSGNVRMSLYWGQEGLYGDHDADDPDDREMWTVSVETKVGFLRAAEDKAAFDPQRGYEAALSDDGQWWSEHELGFLSGLQCESLANPAPLVREALEKMERMLKQGKSLDEVRYKVATFMV